MGNALTTATVSASAIVTKQEEKAYNHGHGKSEASPPPECPMHNQKSPPSECPVAHSDMNEINPLNMVG